MTADVFIKLCFPPLGNAGQAEAVAASWENPKLCIIPFLLQDHFHANATHKLLVQDLQYFLACFLHSLLATRYPDLLTSCLLSSLAGLAPAYEDLSPSLVLEFPDSFSLFPNQETYFPLWHKRLKVPSSKLVDQLLGQPPLFLCTLKSHMSGILPITGHGQDNSAARIILELPDLGSTTPNHFPHQLIRNHHLLQGYFVWVHA